MARKEVTIGAAVFYLQTFAPLDQLRIFGDLQKELLPSLGGVLAAAASKGEDGDVGFDEASLVNAIRAFSGSLDGKGLEAWCAKLIDSERVTFERDGKDARKLTKSNMDHAFEDFTEILELLFHIIQLNFAGPLGRWLGHFGPGLKEKLGGLLEGSETTSSPSS